MMVVAARGRQLQGMTDISSCRRKSASVIALPLSTSTGRQVSRFTVARRLHKGGLFARRTERCLPLKVDHRHHRLQWCKEHKNWTTDQWSCVLFTGESRFSTRSNSQRVLIWREMCTRFYTSNIKGRYHYGGPGVHVCEGIMLNERTELHIFVRESVIGDRYCEEVLLPHVRLFRGAIGPDFIFMDDNARSHRILAVEELLETRLHHPENTQQLKQRLIEEWILLPQVMLHQLVLRLCEATIAFHGSPSTIWYHQNGPGAALELKGDRKHQTVITRLISGHTRGLKFVHGQKTFPECLKCNVHQASSEHLLCCIGLEKNFILENTTMVYDFLLMNGILDLV
ncbi:transposable element Tcb2 transposase [Trichonephila clavipes]|uniref:Transposable element Tcb2 transposase n=1 Tax=Trichonephila clavipes TaxID=2585209 RepID=A0A8X6VV93_TRICX|nr:transposable element Tcb2 transposase [Trichonephila clavipes]